MRLLAIAIGLSILGSLGGIIVASSFLLLGETIRVRLVPWLISYAVDGVDKGALGTPGEIVVGKPLSVSQLAGEQG